MLLTGFLDFQLTPLLDTFGSWRVLLACVLAHELRTRTVSSCRLTSVRSVIHRTYPREHRLSHCEGTVADSRSPKASIWPEHRPTHVVGPYGVRTYHPPYCVARCQNDGQKAIGCSCGYDQSRNPRLDMWSPIPSEPLWLVGNNHTLNDGSEDCKTFLWRITPKPAFPLVRALGFFLGFYVLALDRLGM